MKKRIILIISVGVHGTVPCTAGMNLRVIYPQISTDKNFKWIITDFFI